MSLFINPGTEPRPGTLHHATVALGRFVDQLRHTVIAYRNEDGDRDGYWAWRLGLVHGDQTVDILVPGVEPDITEKGEPWESPRLYVDGSSWLWGYALSIADDTLERTALTDNTYRDHHDPKKTGG